MSVCLSLLKNSFFFRLIKNAPASAEAAFHLPVRQALLATPRDGEAAGCEARDRCRPAGRGVFQQPDMI